VPSFAEVSARIAATKRAHDEQAAEWERALDRIDRIAAEAIPIMDSAVADRAQDMLELDRNARAMSNYLPMQALDAQPKGSGELPKAVSQSPPSNEVPKAEPKTEPPAVEMLPPPGVAASGATFLPAGNGAGAAKAPAVDGTGRHESGILAGATAGLT